MELPLNLYRCGFKLLKRAYKPAVRFYASEKIVPLNETTVIGRIVLFMNNEYIKPNTNKISDELKDPSKLAINKVIDKIKLNQPNHISNLKTEEIEELLCTLKREHYMSNKRPFKMLMEIVDTECCSRLDYLDSTSVLRILNEFTQSVPNRIRDYKFYGQAIDYLMSDIDFLSKEEILQTIFYIGLEKKTKTAQKMLRNCLKKLSKEDIKGLSVEELCIICNSTFKTSTKITNVQILENVRDTLNSKLYLLKDTALFVILIKTLRHNRYHDDDLLNTISYTIFFNGTYKYYSFPVLCHILAIYADAKLYHEELLGLFVDLSLKQLRELKINELEGNIRLKDVSRFLWILSTLGYKHMSEDVFKNIIEPKILECIREAWMEKYIEDLVNSILYMWVLDYQALDLIPYVLTETNVAAIREIKSLTKSRLDLLLTCVFFENRKLFRQFNLKAQRYQPPPIKIYMERRPNLFKVLTALKQLTRESAVNKYELTFEVPHLNICGITGYTKKVYKTVHIEVLDDYVCVNNPTKTPTGPMQLKLRILKEMDSALIVIRSDLIEELSEADLQEYLKSEIELLC